MKVAKKKYDESYFRRSFYKEEPHSQRNKRRLAEILDRKNGGRLLELGCGEGGFLAEAERYFDVEGMDISEYAARKADQLLKGRVMAGNIEEVGLASGSWDVIAAFNILEHLERPSETIKKCHLALRDGGVLIGSVPNNSGLVGGSFTAFSNIMDRTHRSTYAPDLWQSLFEGAGFSKIIFFGEIALGRNLCLYLKNDLWRFMAFNLVFLCVK